MIYFKKERDYQNVNCLNYFDQIPDVLVTRC